MIEEIRRLGPTSKATGEHVGDVPTVRNFVLGNVPDHGVSRGLRIDGVELDDVEIISTKYCTNFPT